MQLAAILEDWYMKGKEPHKAIRVDTIEEKLRSL